MTKSVSKAVIPAAGLGTRFLPATKAIPKEMLPIVEKPTIQYIVEEAVDAGLTDILIITNRGKEAVENHFDSAPELEYYLRSKGKTRELELVENCAVKARLHYVRQGEPKGLGHAVSIARDHVGDEPFVVLLGDDISDPMLSASKVMLSAYEKYGTSILAVQAVPESETKKYGIVDGVEVSSGVLKVNHLVEKPDTGEAPSNLAIIGRYLLTPGIFDCLDRTPPDQHGEIQLTDGLRLLKEQEDMHAVIYHGGRWDVGQVEGFITATIDFAMRDAKLKKHLMRYMRRILEDNL